MIDTTRDTSCDLNPLRNLPGYALRRAANTMMAELAERLSDVGLKIADAALLQLVGERSDMNSSDIGRLLDIQRANMVPLLARLELAGQIRRQPIDRKSQAIVLTEAGLHRLAEARKITAQFEDDLMARIPARHRPHLLPALQALLAEPAV